MATPTFPEGEFYSCTGPESLSHTDPWSAAEEDLDDLVYPRMTVAEVEAEIGRRPLTVTAYRPMQVTDSEADAWADDLLESLAEKWGDEYGDPDQSPIDYLPDDAGEAMRATVRGIVKRMRVWSCDSVGSVTLTGAQVVEWARQERPDWFEPGRRDTEGGR